MTESPQKHKEEEIFAAARVMNSPEKRIAYLDKVCSDNTTMRNEIEELLTIYDRDHSFLDSPPADWNRTASTHSSPVEAPGKMIGPYKILEVIGEGGMGNVYMAEQTEPVHRKVALKIIKSGMDSKTVIARFEAERQALALMDHPNIARFFDAGIAASGSPFFAMELIKGRPIIEFCRQHKLNLKAKLELFQQVCLGVQHAHQKGIIHRDLKPSNVLVARYDDRPVAKVIDFGVAKAVGEKLTDKTMFTRFGQLVGTLEYMSPEQSQFNQLDIDTRSDVYSLGAILYELLTGEPPFEREKLSSAALEEALRIIREDEPTKPSTRLSTLHEADSVENPQNNGKPHRRSASIPVDLDWIVMKCLEKDRSRRYATTNNFTEDLQRFLNNEPIEARPPSTIYRLKKFAKRKHGFVTGVSLVTITLIVSVAVGSVLVWNERQEAIYQRDIANENLTETEKQKSKAEISSASAQRASRSLQAAMNFLTKDMIEGIDPRKTHNPNFTMREALDRAAARVGEAFVDEPLSEATVRFFIGSAYWSLGVNDKAKTHLELALPLLRRHLGSEKPETLRTMHMLAAVLQNQGKYPKARKLYEETLQLRRLILGSDHLETLDTMNNLGLVLSALGDFDVAQKLLAETLKLRQRVLDPDDRVILGTMSNLAQVMRKQRKLVEAQNLYETTLKEMRRVLGDKDPFTLRTMNGLAIVLMNRGKYPEARKIYEEAIALSSRVLSPKHPDTLRSTKNLALVLYYQGEYSEAQKLLEETLLIEDRVMRSEHPDTLITMNILAGVYSQQRKYEQAEKLQKKLLEIRERVRGPQHPSTLGSMNNLANTLKAQGKYSDARKLNEQLLNLRLRILGPKHRNTLGTMNNLASTITKQGKTEEARKLYEKTLTLMRRHLGSEDLWTQNAMMGLARVLSHLGEYIKAQKLFEETLKLRIRVYGPDNPRTIDTMGMLAWFLVTTPDEKIRDPGKALGYARKVVEIVPQNGKHWNILGIAHYRNGNLQSALEAFEKSMNLSSGGDANDWLFLAMIEWRLDHKDKAREWHNKSIRWIEAKKSTDRDVIRFRNEAAKLLGLAIPAPSPKSKNNYLLSHPDHCRENRNLRTQKKHE